MTAVFALATALLWGVSDFGGGLLARRTPALTVVVVSQALASAVLAVIVMAIGGWHEADPELWFAVAAGAVGPVALFCFYRALALGPMGVVSPLCSLGVAVPVGVGLALGERPGLMHAAGISVAVVGILLAGGPQLRGAPVQRQAVVLSLVAAFGFGTVMVLIAEASTTVTGLFLALLVQRVTSALVGGAALVVRVRHGGRVVTSDRSVGDIWSALPAFGCVGCADVAANGAYSLAAQSGPVTVAAVLASLYPVVTAFMARVYLGERLLRVQAAGAGLALIGTTLLAAG